MILGYNAKVVARGGTHRTEKTQFHRTAIIKRPNILLCYETASPLNALTEKAIKSMLFEKSNGKTTFIIAYRLSTVSAADKIIVLDQGRIM